MPIFKNTLFFLVLLPWVAELLGQYGLMKTLAGAFLWAASLLFAILSTQSKQKTQKLCQKLCLFFIFLNFAYLFYNQVIIGQRPPAAGSSLWSLHGIFLGSGFALVLLSCFLLSAGTIKNRALRKNDSIKSKLPSLEFLLSSQNICLRWAFSFWTIGTFLAFANVLANSLETNHAALFFKWISDIKVVFTIFLWLLLFHSLRISRFLNFSSQELVWKKQLFFSFLWILSFIVLSFIPGSEHETLRWFVK